MYRVQHGFMHAHVYRCRRHASHRRREHDKLKMFHCSLSWTKEKVRERIVYVKKVQNQKIPRFAFHCPIPDSSAQACKFHLIWFVILQYYRKGLPEMMKTKPQSTPRALNVMC